MNANSIDWHLLLPLGIDGLILLDSVVTSPFWKAAIEKAIAFLQTVEPVTPASLDQAL